MSRPTRDPHPAGPARKACPAEHGPLTPLRRTEAPRTASFIFPARGARRTVERRAAPLPRKSSGAGATKTRSERDARAGEPWSGSGAALRSACGQAAGAMVGPRTSKVRHEVECANHPAEEGSLMIVELQPLGPAKRADLVFEQLRGRILSGELNAGARLPNERELASALGVNRASVREAVKRLEFLELVDVVHGQGTFVQPMAGSSSLQLIESLLRDPRTVTPALMDQLLEFRRDVTLSRRRARGASAAARRSSRARGACSRKSATRAPTRRARSRSTSSGTSSSARRPATSCTSSCRTSSRSSSHSSARSTTTPGATGGARTRTHAELLAAIEARDAAAARTSSSACSATARRRSAPRRASRRGRPDRPQRDREVKA